MNYLNDLQEINADILEMIRKKQKFPEVLQRFFSALAVIQENQDEDYRISKEVVQEILYPCFQFIIESNYTDNGNFYFLEFQKTYDILKKLLEASSSEIYDNLKKQMVDLSHYGVTSPEFLKRYTLLKKQIKSEIKKVSKEETVHKALVLSVLEITTSFLFTSDYWRNPKAHGLVRKSHDQILEANLVYFWELYELLMELIGLM